MDDIVGGDFDSLNDALPEVAANQQAAAAAAASTSAEEKAAKRAPTKRHPRKKAQVKPYEDEVVKPRFYEHNGLRKVEPYMYRFVTFAKERWLGRTLLDIFSTDFRDRSQEYYAWAMKSGQVTVNHKRASADYILENGDFMCNWLHRHEPPVVAGPVRIVYDGRVPGNDGETLVVEKPGSIPVHATGRYHFNSLLEILKHDYSLPLVHTLNRLDRLTSGLMVCALTVDASKRLGKYFNNQQVRKEYVARCCGNFPDGEVVCDEPLLTIDRQIGVNVVHPDGRWAKTAFKKLRYDASSNTSILHCKPVTGRSHQIRVHLQFLGYPISNDPIYRNSKAWGTDGGKGGVFRSKRCDDPHDNDGSLRAFARTGSEASEKNKQWRREMGDREMARAKSMAESPQPRPVYNKRGVRLDSDADRSAPPTPEDDILDRTAFDVPLTPAARQAISSLRDTRDEEEGWARWRDLQAIEHMKKSAETEGRHVEPTASQPDVDKPEWGFCPTCFVPLLPDPRPEQLFIYLHALRYYTDDWDYSSPMPYWAAEDYKVPEAASAT